MIKEKLAIISSYDDFCGNASYTKALVDGLAKHYEVTVISLDIETLRKGEAKNVRKYIKSICKQLASVDCVNIQFEAGLFGASRSCMKKNFFAIAKASKKLVVTVHRIHGKQNYPSLIQLGKILLKLKFKPFLAEWQNICRNNRWASLYEDVITFCKARKIPVIVHTQRDRKFINLKFGYDQVFDHPLSFYDQDHLEKISKNYTRLQFCDNFSLNENNTYIGIFGFINKYKGHKTAINALKHLPNHYVLLIFGSQHPQSINMDEEINTYIEEILCLVQSLKLTHRVKFFRIANDDDFLKTMLCCDFNVLPYLEVNQGGSGIAALTLETNSKAVFSQNFAFFELAKYATDAFKMFSIGNHLELAQAILSYNKSNFEPKLNEYHKKYNLSTNALLYQRLLSRVT